MLSERTIKRPPVPTDHSSAIFLAQLIALLLAGRLLGEVMLRFGQPAVMGQLIAGLLLGPSVLGALWPEAQHALFPPDPQQKKMLDAVAQLGILMLLLLTGMEMDLSLVRKVRRPALAVSASGIVIPFALGFMLGEFLPDTMLLRPEQRLVTSLFLGIALAIASVKIVAAVVTEMNFARRKVGIVILAAAILDDTIGWVIMAVIFGIAQHGGIDAWSVARTLLGTAAFLFLSFTFGRKAVAALIRWSNDYFVSEMPVITTIFIIMGVMALITDRIGVHTVLGAFVAGMLVGESPILTRHIDEQLRGLIIALFMPVFFALAGLSADIGILKGGPLLLLTGVLILIASVGKFGGAFVGGALSGLSWRECFALGCGMNARGSTEVILASIGLSMGALSQDLYSMIVAMAIATTMAMPPMLRWALSRLPLAPEEQQRLEREELESKGFVSNLERLLLIADESPNGRFASRLAGLLIGSQAILATVLRSMPDGAEPRESGPGEVVKATAESVREQRAREQPDEDAMPPRVEITLRQETDATTEAVAKEARKGYGLLVIGVQSAITASATLDDRVERITAGFEGPYAVVAAREEHARDPLNSPVRVLVPITGSQHSRRALEVALAIARAANSPVTVLYVSPSARRRRSLYGRLQTAFIGQQEQAILRDAVHLGDQYGVPVATAVRAHRVAEQAILREVKHGRHDLVVLGVSRRPGTFLGKVATSMFEQPNFSVLVLAS